ncbi:hypothetical protein [Rufibacter quisquiliarum]|uniref:Uncharacterized protein n=1 Tax=Rufibacter quisquiliarum TaxID=1549639 RepID=A0A839GVS0_9BACT|nr:hypothetical protein [Rufibacter quisquiliarum]MBA9078967.1 hypothetical protein [Rufibacter quisquiliarum]
MTHIQQMREQCQAEQKEVLNLLRVDFGWLFWFRVDAGKAYIWDVLNLDESDNQYIQASPVFWAWWLNQWQLRDTELLNNLRMVNGELVYQTPLASGQLSRSCRTLSTAEHFRIFYRFYHQPNKLQIFPETAVLEGIDQDIRQSKQFLIIKH